MFIAGIIRYQAAQRLEEMENRMAAIKRLWNKNFSILWQGQLISDFGNAAFAVALGFWVLEKTKTAAMPTGDTALMALIEALFAIPGVLFGPLAGVVADRFSRKWIIVAADFIRGLLYSLMGAMLFFDVFPFWLIYPLAVLVGVCGSFFGPAISSSVPDIVPKEDLSKANSARSFSSSATQLVGSSLGGLLYSWLKAPLLILINGFSFLYAAATQIFMKIPLVRRDAEKKHFIREMVEGAKYTFGSRGIRTIIFTGMFINFLAVIGFILITPLFNSEPALGVTKYGYFMCFEMAGMVAGMLTLSIIKIKAAQRSGLFGASILVMVCALVPLGFLKNAVWMYPLAFIAGTTNSIVNMLLQTIMQATVPAENRGKVFGIMSTVMGGLQPLAMVAGGVIARYAGVRPTMIVSFSILVFAVLPMVFDRNIKKFINTDIAQAAPAAEDQTQAAEAPAALSPSGEG